MLNPSVAVYICLLYSNVINKYDIPLILLPGTAISLYQYTVLLNNIRRGDIMNGL